MNSITVHPLLDGVSTNGVSTICEKNHIRNLQINGYAGDRIRSFGDWEKHALPPKRKERQRKERQWKERQWKERRSELDLDATGRQTESLASRLS
jgi:hypothetical protein